MTLIIVSMLIISYLLIATGHLTRVNKSAIAVFLGTIGWVVYISWGTDFVMSQHPREYAEYLAGEEPSSNAVKFFIYNEIFLSYVGRAASIVMFLLATMSIIEILNNNGCFDFMRHRDSSQLRRMLYGDRRSYGNTALGRRARDGIRLLDDSRTARCAGMGDTYGTDQQTVA